MDVFLVMHLKLEVEKNRKASAFPISRERRSLKKMVSCSPSDGTYSREQIKRV